MHAKSALVVLTILAAGCGVGARRTATDLTGGDPARGAPAVARYGCGSCHTIPGVAGAHGLVGPALGGVRNRVYIAGVLTNNASNIERWIEKPHAINQRTVMPDLGVSDRDAADIAAFLYSLP